MMARYNSAAPLLEGLNEWLQRPYTTKRRGLKLFVHPVERELDDEGKGVRLVVRNVINADAVFGINHKNQNEKSRK